MHKKTMTIFPFDRCGRDDLRANAGVLILLGFTEPDDVYKRLQREIGDGGITLWFLEKDDVLALFLFLFLFFSFLLLPIRSMST